MLPILSSTSLPEASQHVLELVKKQDEEPKIEETRPSLKKTPRSDHKSPEERELEKVEMKLRNVQLALEILTGVCATLPDPDPASEVDEEADADAEVEEDGEESEDEDDDNEEKVDVEMDNNQPEFEIKANNTTPPAMPSFLITVLPSLLPLIHPTPLSFPPVISGTSPATASPPPPTHLPTTSALGAIHVSALECLNNACLALSLAHESNSSAAGVKATRPDVEDGRRLWDAVWSALSAVGLEGGRGQERRREMWEVAVGVLWGIGGIWKGSIVSHSSFVFHIRKCMINQLLFRYLMRNR